MTQQLPSPPSDLAWLDRLMLPAAIIRDARFVHVNDAFLSLLGLPREEAVGRRFDERVAPEDARRIAERHQQRLAGQAVPDSYEFDVIRGDGQRRTVEIYVSQSGAETLFQLYDVTGRVARHQNLRALARLGAAVQGERSDAAIFRAVGRGLVALGAAVVRVVPAGAGVQIAAVFNAAGPVLAEGRQSPWSAWLQQAWDAGYAFVDDLEGATAQLLGEEGRQLHPQEKLPGLRGAMIRIEELGKPREVLLVSAGWIRPEDQATLALFGAQISAALDAARVISDLSSRNAELLALNHVATAAGELGELGELLDRAGSELAEVTGCVALAMYLVDGPWANLLHSWGGSTEARRLFARVPLEGTRLGEVVSTGTSRIWRRTDYEDARAEVMKRMGQEVVVSVPLVIRSEVLGVLNIAHALPREVRPQEVELLSAVAAHLSAKVESSRLVADLRHSYAELTSAQAKLVRGERLAALGEMAAALAHEVRNPLGVILNSLSALRRLVEPTPEATQLLAMTREESERINHLVEDLLEFARPTQPALGDDRPLPAAIQEAVGPLVAAAPGVRFELRAPADLGPVVMDARLMRQVFVNLANNALHAMGEGGVLEVTVSREGPLVRVSFQDTGDGIGPEALPHVFEPFFTTRARGSGLGLALVKRIVEGHQGQVRAISTPGQGACVVLEWPTLP